jgi:hypothetical protein
MRRHRHDRRLSALSDRIAGSRATRLPATVLVLAAVAIAGCGGSDEPTRESAQAEKFAYADFGQVSLGTKRAAVERRFGAPDPAINEEFAIDARERESCSFYLLEKDQKNAPDAMRLCFDSKDRLESTSTVDADREAPDQPADAGKRDDSLAAPQKTGGKKPQVEQR